MHNARHCFEALTRLFLITASCCYVRALAQFTTSPVDTTVTEGNSLTVDCSFTSADRLFWRKDGVEIVTSNFNFIIETVDASTSRLTLQPSVNHMMHAGAYECVAVSGSSESVVEFNITVQYLSDPVVRFEPFECVEEGKNPYLGSTVIIDCIAEGEPFPQITWFFNGMAVTEGEGRFTNARFERNNSRLAIDQLNVTNVGHYLCQSENVIGQRSAMQELGYQTVDPDRMPEIVNDINGVIFAPMGGIGKIQCRVIPPIPRINASAESVIFREGTTAVQPGFGYNILFNPKCSTFSLIINNISTVHATQYQCSFGRNTVTTRLKIGMIIPLRVNISSSVIGVGRDVTMNCSFGRAPGSLDVPQMLVWRFTSSGSPMSSSGSIIPDGKRVTIVRDEAGTSANLTVRDVTMADHGTYVCRGFNPSNLAVPMMREVNLTVEDRPNITVTTPTPVVRVGTSLLITCSIDTRRSSTFSWTVNGIPVTSSNTNYTVTRPLPYQSLLNITSVLPRDIGPIRCTAEDPLHLPAYEVVTVNEEVEPYVVGDGSGVAMVNVPINTALSLKCELRGVFTATPTFSWFLGNRQLTNGVTVSTISGVSELRKDSVSLEDDATYLCVVSLGAQRFLMNFVAFVTIPPMLREMLPESTEGVQGQRFELTCAVAGRPPPRVFWMLSVNRVSELGDPSIRDAQNGSLIFEPLRMNHTGIYSCSVEGAESISDKTSLMVVDSDSVFRVGILNKSETILVFTVCGLVAVLVLIATVMLIAVVISCYFMRRSPQGKYTVKHDSIDGGAFKRQASLRDNSGIHSSPSNHIFDTLQSPGSASSPYNNPYSTGPPTAVPMATYQGPAPVYYHEGGGAVNSIFSEPINSHTSTPIHGTMASTSLFESEEHTSVTAQLPNFPRSNLQLGDVMGEGEFGPVIMGVATNIVPHEERTLVAVKELVPRGEEGEEDLNPEVALVDFANQMKLEFANIAMILGMCTDVEPYYVIYEYLDEGDLKKFLINSRPLDDDPPSLTPQHMRKIILQVADGMAYLFSQRIIHGDLATRNCLVSSDLRVKIADLGIGHDLYNHDYYDNGSQLLPIRWMPPELLVTSDDGPTFSLHSDIWSFGVFCWEVFSYSRLPYDAMTDEEVLSMVPAGTRLRSPSKSCPPALYDIMMDCWHDIPEERPVFAKLCVAIIGCELD